MQRFLEARPALTARTPATVREIRYPTHDGTAQRAFLFLPPGKASAAGLPGVVFLPGNGPHLDDLRQYSVEAQFLAAKGYAVLEPDFRGTGWYGPTWFLHTGFGKWRESIDDIADAARWLAGPAATGGAPVALVGYHYGGYAALQVAATYPDLVKRVVGYDEARRAFGTGALLRDASPAQNAGRITAAVLLAHDTQDVVYPYAQSELMAQKLRAAGKPVELAGFSGTFGGFAEGAQRAAFLARMDGFLKGAMP